MFGHSLSQIPPTELVDLFICGLHETPSSTHRNPTNESGGLFILSIQTRRLDRSFESHPRKWVDCSSPTYKRRRFVLL